MGVFNEPGAVVLDAACGATGMFEVNLPPTKQAPGMARRSIATWLAPAVDPEALGAATLLVSELVTNAVRHGCGEITLRATLDEDRLMVEVIDQGRGAELTVGQPDSARAGGRGLAIVDAVASRWGIHEGTTHVWFELEQRGPCLGTRTNPAAA